MWHGQTLSFDWTSIWRDFLRIYCDVLCIIRSPPSYSNTNATLQQKLVKLFRSATKLKCTMILPAAYVPEIWMRCLFSLSLRRYWTFRQLLFATYCLSKLTIQLTINKFTILEFFSIVCRNPLLLNSIICPIWNEPCGGISPNRTILVYFIYKKFWYASGMSKFLQIENLKTMIMF